MKYAFNSDNSGYGIARTIKAVQYKLSFANFVREGAYAATAVLEIYEVQQ